MQENSPFILKRSIDSYIATEGLKVSQPVLGIKRDKHCI